MEKTEEGRRYKWSNSATNLLVSIWSHDQVQNQLRMSTRNQPIWESIARYMTRKGFTVTGMQCRTRIKNMLCNYHEAVRKNDPSIIEPYFDIFKKATLEKAAKRKEGKYSNKQVKQEAVSEDSEGDEVTIQRISENSLDMEPNQNISDSGYHIEYLDINNEEAQASASLLGAEALIQLEKTISKAIENQTKAITNAIKSQSQIVDKLLNADKQRLEAILASERESRRLLEVKIDRLLSRFETSAVPQQAFMGPVIESQQNDDEAIERINN